MINTVNRDIMRANQEILTRRAEVLRVISHPQRLFVLRGLQKHRCNVSQIQVALGLTQSGLSQHLSRLKAVGVIKGVRKGKEICYEIIDEEVIKILAIVFSDLQEPVLE